MAKYKHFYLRSISVSCTDNSESFLVTEDLSSEISNSILYATPLVTSNNALYISVVNLARNAFSFRVHNPKKVNFSNINIMWGIYTY